VSGLVLWDFDGTLAERPGMWRGCLVETLDADEPGHSNGVGLLEVAERILAS